ncbi:hypothetical protein C0585_05805 [Candidatus Woesearchaeota archaeon]|nr:MAG: hypothetical protein C0585_05805 [Candidatus Woesearchaeota archaeon]
MDFRDSFNYLEKKDYFNFSKKRLRLFSNVLRQTLKPISEKVIVIGDTGHENFGLSTKLSAKYFLACENIGVDAKVYLQNPKERGESANPEIIQAMKNLPENNIIVANLSNKFGSMKHLGNSFRSFCKEKNHRFISTTSLGFITNEMEEFLYNTLDIDYKRLSKKHAKLKEIFDEGDEVRITTEIGTDLRIGIKKKTAISADGLYHEPGSGGNLPSGEVYIPPRKKQVWGNVVIDGSSRTIERTNLIDKPFNMKIKDGEITKIEGDSFGVHSLLDSLKWAWNNSKYGWGVKRIGELGIGLNPNAKLIGSTIVDEKVLGTAHIAIGSNHWMGGTIYSIIHLDQVFKKPVIEVDGNEIDIDKL